MDPVESAGAWSAFVDGLLRVDPAKRYSAHQALSRDIFELDALADRAAARRKKSVSRDASPTLLAQVRHAALGLSPADVDKIGEALVASSPTRRRRQSVSREASPDRLAEARRTVDTQPLAGAANTPSPQPEGLAGSPSGAALGSSMGGLIKKFAPLVSDMFGSRQGSTVGTDRAATTTVKPPALNHIAPSRLAGAGAAGGEGGGGSEGRSAKSSPAAAAGHD